MQPAWGLFGRERGLGQFKGGEHQEPSLWAQKVQNSKTTELHMDMGSRGSGGRKAPEGLGCNSGTWERFMSIWAAQSLLFTPWREIKHLLWALSDSARRWNGQSLSLIEHLVCALHGSGPSRLEESCPCPPVSGALQLGCLGSRGYPPWAETDGSFQSSLRFIDQRGWNFPERGINLATDWEQIPCWE